MSSMIRRKRSIYADIFIKHAHRARFTPKVRRAFRPKVIAWAGPTAFSNNRFYNLDKWYKARITKPEFYPKLHLIDPDDYTQSLKERLSGHTEAINIGFKSRQNVDETVAKITFEMEVLALKNNLRIDISNVEFNQIAIFKHYKIFGDLFIPGVYFYMTQEMNVFYGDSEVITGNLLCASKSVEKPSVKLESLNNPEAYNSLFMVNMDGDFFEPEVESSQPSSSDVDNTQVLHWLVGNIPDGADLSKGEEMVPYIQPIPVKGTGYHRIAFVLFRHKKKIDFSHFKLKSEHLSERVFRMNRFYKQHEKDITPTAVKFCQMKWHESCGETLKRLGMKIPYYHYEWNRTLPPPPQREFPEKSYPFNLYLDQYRSRESIQKEMAKHRLERLVHEGTIEKSKYPDILYQENRSKLAPWQQTELIKENIGLGKYGLIYNPEPINAAEQADLEAQGKVDPYKPEFEKSAVEKL